MAKVSGIEILSCGRWKNRDFTEDDLANYAAQQNEIALKEGHDSNEQIGAVSKLYMQGKKLLADFVAVPASVIEKIKSKVYQHVSCEIDKGILSAVALLAPGVAPACKDLATINLSEEKVTVELDYIALSDIEEDKPVDHSWIDAHIKAGRVLPYERESIVNHSLTLDNTIKLSDNETQLEQFKKVIAARPIQVKLSEAIPQAADDGSGEVGQHYEQYKNEFAKYSISKEQLISAWKKSGKTAKEYLKI